MAGFSKETIANVREIDLLTYLKECEPHQLVKCSRGTYCTKEHDSLKISNGKWMWFSQGIGGSSALDYLIKVNGLSFIGAVERLLDLKGLKCPQYYSNEFKTLPKADEPLLLPKKSDTSDVVTNYLQGRGIDKEIIDYCLEKGLMFESLPYHNVVFVGYDTNGIAQYGGFRACNNTRIMGDCSGSKKDYSFKIFGTNKSEVHLFESAIDLLSYATLCKMDGKDWDELTLLSLSGVYASKKDYGGGSIPIALTKFLKNNIQTERIVLHLDNDSAGRNATRMLMTSLSGHLEVVDDPPIQGKDFNDFLCLKLNIKSIKERSYER